MSKKSRIIKQARAELGAGSLPVVRAKGPADVLAMIPYLVGFVPTNSIVVIALEGPRKHFGPCIRMDLAGRDGAGTQADYLASVIAHHGFDPVIVVAFSQHRDRARAVIEQLESRLLEAGVEILELLRADGERWWSYQCTDGSCCDASGTPYDADSSALAATAVLAGMAKAAGRDDLRACFEPGSASLRAQVADSCSVLEASDLPDIGQVLNGALATSGPLSPEQLAALAVGAQPIASRDVAWSMMSRRNAASHLDVWAQVTRAAPDRLLPAVGSLAGFAAWLSGSGVLASHAAERVERVDPTYSMNRLLIRCLEMTVDPRDWEDFRGGPCTSG
ncbi:MAG: DUF4192 domain-containing protein [Nocardioidaceae bacterium]|nr:DUF4192 domain-containing protein [Nocardioidaceae bacterium]